MSRTAQVIILTTLLLLGSMMQMITADVPDIQLVDDMTVATWDISSSGNLSLTDVDIVDGKAILSTVYGDHNISQAAEFQQGSFDNVTLNGDTVTLDVVQGWWDPAYRYRRPIKIHNLDGDELEMNFTVNVTLDTTVLVSDGKMLSNASDLRVVFDGGVMEELDRWVSAPDSASTKVSFRTMDKISASSWNNGSYYIYYGNPYAFDPPSNMSNIFLWFDDFSTDTISSYTAERDLLNRDGGTLGAFAHNAVLERVEVFVGVANGGAILLADVPAQNYHVEAVVHANNTYSLGWRQTNFQMCIRQQDMDNYYMESFYLVSDDPVLYAWSGGIQQGPLDTVTGILANEDQNHTLWMSVLNDSVRGGLDGVEHLSATDSQVTGPGSFGMGIRSGDGYLYSLIAWAIAENMPVLEVGVEEEGIYLERGSFLSAPIDLGHAVEWGTVNWSMVAPPGTAMIINLRASPDGTSWTPWSKDLDDNSGMNIPLGPDRYLQFKAVLRTTSHLVTPALDRIDIGFSRYHEQGTVETEDLEVDRLLSWRELNFTRNGPGSVTWYYSSNSGSAWDPVPVLGDLSSVTIGPGILRIRAVLSTNNTTQTPELDGFSLSYLVNKVPWLIKDLGTASFPEDSSLVGAYNLSEHFGDEENLTFEGVADTTNISLTIHQNGSVDVASVLKDWYGQATILFRAEDPYGEYLEAGANITVTPVNDRPVIESSPTMSVNAGEAYAYQITASDVDDDDLTFGIDGPDGMTVNDTGHIAWLTSESDYGDNPISISVSDGAETVWQNFTVTVERIAGNRAPVIGGLNVTLVFVGNTYVSQVLASDADNDTLSFALDVHPDGMSIDPATGLIQWIPEEKDVGNVTVKVNVSDPFTYVTMEFVIQVLSSSSNNRPVIQGLDRISLKDEPIDINLTEHVTDPEEPSEDLVWRIESSSADLFTAELIDKHLKLSPLEDVEGKRTIRLVVRDSGGLESEVTLTVVVDNKKDVPPTFAEQMFSDYLLFWLLPLILVVIIIAVVVASRKRSPARGGIDHGSQARPPAAIPVHVKARPVKMTGGDEDVEPVAPPEVIKEPEEIGKATVYIITLLRTLMEKDIIVGGETLGTALRTIAEKDGHIDRCDIDQAGQVTLAPSEDSSLEEVSKAYGTLLDAVLLVGHGLRGLKDRRDKTIEVAEDVLKGEKGPAASSLRSNMLGGQLANDIQTGIQGLDDFLGGGLPKGDAMLLQMPSGREKAQVALQMARSGFESEQGVIVALSDISPEQFLSDSERIGFDAKAAVDAGLLRIVDWNTYKTKRVRDVEEEGHVIRASKSLTNLMIAISDSMKKFEEGDTKRIILDVVSPAVNIFGIDSSYRFLQSLVARLKENGFTSVFILMKDMLEPEELGTISQNFDNVVDIVRRREDKRIIWEAAVLSMSRAGYSSDVREIEFSDKGLVIK